MAITYQEIKRETKPWGIEVLMSFSNEGKLVRTTNFRFKDTAEITAELAGRCAKKIFNIQCKASALNGLELGEDSGEILVKLIKAIRSNPDLTITQATGWFDANYTESLFSGIQLLKRFRTYLTKELGFEPTWDQFKTYVINNKFARLDNYND